jgi:hypothetical protein
MKRIVITPWDGKNPELLKQCKDSVRESGIPHLIVRCGPDWEQKMFNVRDMADYVAWVDSDDIVYPGALQAAFELAEKTQAGLIYSDELHIDINGDEIGRTEGECALMHMITSPQAVHHLTVTKKGSISNRVIEVYNKSGCPIDWAMRIAAATHSGAVHLPMLAYGWRHHGNQITANESFHEDLKYRIKPAADIFRQWVLDYEAVTNTKEAECQH